MIELPKAVFFDMDGTILDWQTGMEESWITACEAHCDGLTSPPAMHDAIRLRRTWFWSDFERATRGRMDLDGASREIVRSAFADLDLRAFDVADALADSYRSLRNEQIVPYDGAIATLRAFRERGVALALLTNGEARNQRRSVEKHELGPYFDCIVIEGEFGCGKPDERVFRHALAACGVDPPSAWMVGDSLEADITPAVALGMHAVWVDAEGAGLPEDGAVRPHRTVRAISELITDG